MALFKSQAPSIISESIARAKAAANEERKTKAAKAWNYYRGRQHVYLEQDINDLFPESQDIVREYKALGPNMVAWITNLNSMVYKNQVLRVVDDEKTNELYKDWATRVKLDLLMDMANKRTFVERVIHIRVNRNGSDVDIDIIGQDITDVIQKEMKPSEARAIIYEINSVDTLTGDPKILYVYTDSETHFVFDESDNVIEIAENPDFSNPYGELNFVKCEYQLSTDEYFDMPSERLIDLQSIVNIEETEMNYIKAHQAFSIPFLTNWNGKNDPVLSPTRPLVFNSDMDGQTGSLNFATPNPAIATMWTIAKEKRAEAANEHNIDPMAFRIDGTAPSGEALKASAHRLVEERQRQLKFWNSYEVQIFELWKKSMVLAGNDIKADSKIVIDFGEIGFEMTVEELGKDFDLQRKYLLAGPLDIYRQYNSTDSSTDDEVMKKQEKIDRDWKQAEQKFSRAQFAAPVI